MTHHDDDDVSWDQVPTRTVHGPTNNQREAAQEVVEDAVSSIADSNDAAATASLDVDRSKAEILAGWKELQESPITICLTLILVCISFVCLVTLWKAEQERTSGYRLAEQRWSELSQRLSEAEAESSRLGQVLLKGQSTKADEAMEMEVGHDQFCIFSDSKLDAILQEQGKKIEQLQRQIEGTQFQAGEVAIKKFKVGEGFREYSGRVRFPEKFKFLPQVTVSLKGFDGSLDEKSWMTVRTKVEAVHREYFDFKVATWSDSQLHLVDIGWTAIAVGKIPTNPED